MVAFHYAYAAFVSSLRQIAVLLGGFALISFAMWHVSQAIRRRCGSRFGMGYYYFVAPGVVCHETGHAVGCLLSRVKIRKFVPFHPEPDGTLGYVAHEVPSTFLGKIAYILVSTGPIWFGSIVILLLAKLLLGASFGPVLDNVRTSAAAMSSGAISSFVPLVCNAAVELVRILASGMGGHPWRTAVFCYLVFCIASETTLSAPDLKSCATGCWALFAVLFLTNLIVGSFVDISIFFIRLLPCLAISYAVLAMVLIMDVAAWVVVRILVRI